MQLEVVNKYGGQYIKDARVRFIDIHAHPIVLLHNAAISHPCPSHA